MGMQDRDYYREWWAEKQGYKERTKFRLPATHKESDESERTPTERITQQKPKVAEWHPVLIAMMTILICLCEYGLFKIISIYARH